MAGMATGETADLTLGSPGDYLLCEITASDGNWNTADTTIVEWAGWTTDRASNEYLRVVALDDGARHQGMYSASYYRLDAGSSEECFDFNNGATELAADFDGIQLRNTETEEEVVYCHGTGADIVFTDCVLIGAGSLYYLVRHSSGNMEWYNCVMDDTQSSTGVYGVRNADSGLTAKIYNCTIYGHDYNIGIYMNSGYTVSSVLIKNCAIFGHSDDFEVGDWTNWTVDYCAHDDADEGAAESNHVDISPAGDGGEATSWAKCFDNYATGDFSLATPSGSNYLYHTGLDQNSDGSVPAYDIVETERPSGANSVSIGAWELPTGAAPSGAGGTGLFINSFMIN
jgi:hypothetical protein